jgi:hypothetical protein
VERGESRQLGESRGRDEREGEECGIYEEGFRCDAVLERRSVRHFGREARRLSEIIGLD